MVPHQQYCQYCKAKQDLDNEIRSLREFHGNLAVQKLVSDDIQNLRHKISKMEPCLHSRAKKMPDIIFILLRALWIRGHDAILYRANNRS